MFASVKNAWALSKIGASIEGVVRETGKGNGNSVRQWYDDYLHHKRAYADKHKLSDEEVIDKALAYTNRKNLEPFLEIVSRLTQPGELLHEIDEYHAPNRPTEPTR